MRASRAQPALNICQDLLGLDFGLGVRPLELRVWESGACCERSKMLGSIGSVEYLLLRGSCHRPGVLQTLQLLRGERGLGCLGLRAQDRFTDYTGILMGSHCASYPPSAAASYGRPEDYQCHVKVYSKYPSHDNTKKIWNLNVGKRSGFLDPIHPKPSPLNYPKP